MAVPTSVQAAIDARNKPLYGVPTSVQSSIRNQNVKLAQEKAAKDSVVKMKQRDTASSVLKQPNRRPVSYIGNDGAKATGTANTTPQVTPGKTPDYYTELGNLYKTAYDAQVEANNKALEEARLRAQETTDAQIAALADQYAGTNRQLYRDYMNSRKILPQQLAAAGYNGGLSESSMLRLNNSYEEGLNENERARLAQETSYNQALAQQMYEAQAKAAEANSAAMQNWYGQQATLKDMIYKDAQQRAATMAASGDFSEYKRLGFSDSEINYLKQMWKKMNPDFA